MEADDVIDLTQVMTFSEAAEKWGFANGNTIRKAVERKKFNQDEIRKSGDVWLTTYQAMYRVFGQPRKSDEIISYEEFAKLFSESFYLHKSVEGEINKIIGRISDAINHNRTVTLVKSYDCPDQIMMVIKTKNDLETYENTLRRYVTSMSLGTKKD